MVHYNIYHVCMVVIASFTTPAVSQGGGPNGFQQPKECNVAIGLNIEECKVHSDGSQVDIKICHENNTYPICLHERSFAKIKNEPFASTLIPGKFKSDLITHQIRNVSV